MIGHKRPAGCDLRVSQGGIESVKCRISLRSTSVSPPDEQVKGMVNLKNSGIQPARSYFFILYFVLKNPQDAGFFRVSQGGIESVKCRISLRSTSVSPPDEQVNGMVNLKNSGTKPAWSYFFILYFVLCTKKTRRTRVFYE